MQRATKVKELELLKTNHHGIFEAHEYLYHCKQSKNKKLDQLIAAKARFI